MRRAKYEFCDFSTQSGDEILVMGQKLKEKVPSQCLIVADKVNFTKKVEHQLLAQGNTCWAINELIACSERQFP